MAMVCRKRKYEVKNKAERKAAKKLFREENPDVPPTYNRVWYWRDPEAARKRCRDFWHSLTIEEKRERRVRWLRNAEMSYDQD